MFQLFGFPMAKLLKIWINIFFSTLNVRSAVNLIEFRFR